MHTQLRQVLSGFLILALLFGICAGGFAPEVSAAQPQNPNAAQGKSVAFASGAEIVPGDADYGIAAIKAGLRVLTDGINNSPNWWINNGNPYVALKSSVVSGPYIFSVDLGANYETEQISLYNYARTDWGITPADSVTFTISADGSSWSTLGTVKLADALVNTVIDTRNGNAEVNIYEFALKASVPAAMSVPPSTPTAKGSSASVNLKFTPQPLPR